MFRKMRRNPIQKLSDAETMQILESNTSGVLCVFDGEYPYGVPLSYTVIENKIYFHSAVAGHKIDAIENCNKASFTVIAKDEIVPGEFTTYFQSVVAFGEVRLLAEEAEKRAVLRKLAEKYSMDFMDKVEDEIGPDTKSVNIIEFTIEHVSGKEAIELAKARRDK